MDDDALAAMKAQFSQFEQMMGQDGYQSLLEQGKAVSKYTDARADLIVAFTHMLNMVTVVAFFAGVLGLIALFGVVF